MVYIQINNIEREKSEKVKISNQVKHIPKDAQVVMSILKELGVQDYEPRVINQLLEFTYRRSPRYPCEGLANGTLVTSQVT